MYVHCFQIANIDVVTLACWPCVGNFPVKKIKSSRRKRQRRTGSQQKRHRFLPVGARQQGEIFGQHQAEFSTPHSKWTAEKYTNRSM